MPAITPNRALAAAVFTRPTTHNRITLHDAADDSLRALLAAIKAAQSSFYVETFIWHNDAAGLKVANALIARKRAALAQGKAFDVKILIDFTGEHDPSVPTHDPLIIDYMRRAGLDVRVFNAAVLDPQATGRTPITHRKLYIQDGREFLTGGRNLGDEYLRSTSTELDGHREQAWHDLLVTVRGDETGRVVDEFIHNWLRAGGSRPARRPLVVPDLDGRAVVQSFTTDPLAHTHALLDAQLRAIAAARSEIRIIYPYFSDDSLIQALVDAKRRRPGLAIKVMLPAKDEGGVTGLIYRNLNDVTAARLIRAGIQVRKLATYREGHTLASTFSHLKALVVDAQLLSVGSANGDARTMHANFELATLIDDPQTARAYIAEVLQPDWQRARPVSLYELAQKPWPQRLLGWLLARFGYLF